MKDWIGIISEAKKIKVDGYRGFWSVVDSLGGYVMLEHNTYGDEMCYLVVWAGDIALITRLNSRTGERETIPHVDESVVVYETYDDIQTCLKDKCIFVDEESKR